MPPKKAAKQTRTRRGRWIEYRPLSSITKAKANPKGHALEDLRASVERFGFIEPIIEDSRTGRLLSGHGRLETLAAAEKVGIELPDGIRIVAGEWAVPVVCGWSSANDIEAKAALVGVNHLVELGGWHAPDLTKMLDSIKSSGGVWQAPATTTTTSMRCSTRSARITRPRHRSILSRRRTTTTRRRGCSRSSGCSSLSMSARRLSRCRGYQRRIGSRSSTTG